MHQKGGYKYPYPKRTEELFAGLKKMNLDDKFDLLEHSVANKLVLPEHHVFNGFNRFCHTIANTTNRQQILHTLVEFMKHDFKMAGEYTK